MMESIGRQFRRALRAVRKNRPQSFQSTFEVMEDRKVLANYIWSGAVDTLWSTQGNWVKTGTGGNFPGQNNTNDTVRFDGASPVTNTTATLNVDLVNRLGQVEFKDGSGITTLNVNETLLTKQLTVQASAGAPVINFGVGGEVNFNDVFTISIGSTATITNPINGKLIAEDGGSVATTTIASRPGAILPTIEFGGSTFKVNSALTLGGDWTNTGGSPAVWNSGPLVLQGLSGQTQSVSDSLTTFAGVTISQVSGSILDVGTMNSSGTVIINNINSGDASFVGTLTTSGPNVESFDTTVPAGTGKIVTSGAPGNVGIRAQVTNAQFPNLELSATGEIQFVGSVVLRGDVVQTGGTIAHSNNTVTFSGPRLNRNLTFLDGLNTFRHVNFAMTGISTLLGDIETTGNIDISNQLQPITPTSVTNGFLEFKGAGPRTLTGGATNDRFLPGVRIQPTANLISSGMINARGGFINNGGVGHFTPGTNPNDVWTFSGPPNDPTKPMLANGESFENLVVATSLDIIAGSGPLAPGGAVGVTNLTYKSGGVNGTFDVSGNYDNQVNSIPLDLTINFVGSGAQTLTSNSARQIPKVTVNKTGGSIDFVSDGTLAFANGLENTSASVINDNGLTTHFRRGGVVDDATTNYTNVLIANMGASNALTINNLIGASVTLGANGAFSGMVTATSTATSTHTAGINPNIAGIVKLDGAVTLMGSRFPSIEVASGADVTVSGTVDVTGNYNDAGSNSVTGGTIAFKPLNGVNTTITNGNFGGDVTINAGSENTATLSGGLTVGGLLTLATGTLGVGMETVSAGSFQMNSSGKFSITHGVGIINVTSAATINGGNIVLTAPAAALAAVINAGAGMLTVNTNPAVIGGGKIVQPILDSLEIEAL